MRPVKKKKSWVHAHQTACDKKKRRAKGVPHHTTTEPQNAVEIVLWWP